MSKNAPDTRNRLDSSKDLNKTKPPIRTKNTKNPTLGDKYSVKHNAELDKKNKKKTKGQLFKEAYGHTKTMKRNCRNAGGLTIAEYREVRKKRKKTATMARQKKHLDSVLYKRANGKKKAGKGGKKASVTVDTGKKK